MLCPEIWNFPTSRPNTSYQFGNYDNKGTQTVDRFIKSSPFNQMVSIVLPDCESIPVAIKQLIDASDYYLIRNLKLSDLVRRDFVQAFIKRGRLTGISSEVGKFNSSENVFAITPGGKLILSISKDLYQILGIEGRPATSLKRNRQQFEITIDLNSKDIHEQSKFYNRIKRALSSSEIDPFDFVLSWDSIDSTVCPSSVAKFFNDCGYKVEQHSIQVLSSTTKDLKIPNQLFSTEQIDSDLVHTIAEYLAYFMLKCDTTVSEEISTYKPTFDFNLENEHSTDALVVHCKGLLTADFITKLMEVSRLSAQCKSLTFNVNAYEKAPVTRTNGYIIKILNDTQYFLFKT